MNLKMKAEGVSSDPGGMSSRTIIALVAAGVLGIGGMGWAISKAFEDPKAKKAVTSMSSDEAKLAAKGEAEKQKAQIESGRIKQSDVGTGVEFDAQGNMVQKPTQGQDLGGLQNMALDQVQDASDRAKISAGIQRGPSSYVPPQEGRDADPAVLRERREIKKEERQENNAPTLSYSTSRSATWALRRPEVHEVSSKSAQLSDAEQIAENNSAITKLTNLAERSLEQQSQTGGPAVAVNVSNVAGQGGTASRRVTPAQNSAQVAEPGEIADMRVGSGIGPDMVVREGKFLDCALVNRVESDINDSPVTLQVTRDFVSPDGRYVLVPAGSKIYGVAGSVQSLQQARLYMAFHRIVYPTRQGENQSLSAYFPKRRFPGMDNMGSLGVKDLVNRHFILTFGSAIMLGLFDGAAASVQSAGSTENPTMRDLMLARTSQNFASIVNNVIQRYANVVPTVTLREGKKCKVYFTQDVMMSPWMESKNLSWVSGSDGGQP